MSLSEVRLVIRDPGAVLGACVGILREEKREDGVVKDRWSWREA